jgi:hypothetical protein
LFGNVPTPSAILPDGLREYHRTPKYRWAQARFARVARGFEENAN